jgi:hypothetical protein
MSDLIEAMARAMCAENGRDPDQLEPGDALGIDGHRNGEPCHFKWRHWTDAATAALAALRETHHLVPKDQEPVGWRYDHPDGGVVFLREKLHRDGVLASKTGWTEQALYALEKRHD